VCIPCPSITSIYGIAISVCKTNTVASAHIDNIVTIFFLADLFAIWLAVFILGFLMSWPAGAKAN